uniref:Eukaryotic translation initiation factor 3 subunit J n=1 Tax=Schistosoma mansoni TaxID=6183 RepID=A0A3Q0KCF8_SCHMA
MGDWDDEDESDFVAKQVKVDWDDEEDNAVPDSWDAEPPKDSVTSKPAAPAKLSLSERLKLKEEQKRKEKEEKLRREEKLRLSQPVTELQREKLAEEAELGLLKDTFGPSTVQSNDKETIDSCCPKTKEDFNHLHSLLAAKITTIQKSPHFTAFAESLIRDLVIEMEVDALRTVNTVINALINEKQKLVKSKTKKKTKGKLLVERENDYQYGVDDDALPDEYDDFM